VTPASIAGKCGVKKNRREMTLSAHVCFMLETGFAG
jgi:hypothetical protein